MCNRYGTYGPVVGLFLLCFLLACASPRSSYPELARVLESDVELDCNGYDDELLKANAIRDAIYEEHGDVIERAYLSSAVDVAMDPVLGTLSSVIEGRSTAKAAKTYREAADAAGLRMEQMLIYKERARCPAGRTGDPDVTDSFVLTRLQELNSQLGENEISERQYFVERKELLDGLR